MEIKQNILFLGFAIPDEEMTSVFVDDTYPQVQTHKFNWNIIKGMEYFDEFEITYISSRPVSDYPRFQNKIIRGKKWVNKVQKKYIEIIEVPFLNKGLLKLLSRFFSVLYYGIKEFYGKQNKAGVIVYSVHVPYMLAGLIISKIFKMDYIAIWTDPPAVSGNRDSFLKSKLRGIELRLSKYLMKKPDKIIALTKYIAEDFAPGKPYIVVEGIVDVKEIETKEGSRVDDNSNIIRIVYTGSLDKRYGINNIIEGVVINKNKNIVLEIYGKGDYEDQLVKISKLNNKIKYMGFRWNKEILKIQREASFLINARSSTDDYVKYSFPSKTLEYMLSGTPLITTMLPGIPTEYKNFIIELEDNSPNTISNRIDYITELKKEEVVEIGNKAQEFAKKKNYVIQAEKMIDFIKTENVN